MSWVIWLLGVPLVILVWSFCILAFWEMIVAAISAWNTRERGPR
jgi:uncharacterized protein YggT (Ycf19 family)